MINQKTTNEFGNESSRAMANTNDLDAQVTLQPPPFSVQAKLEGEEDAVEETSRQPALQFDSGAGDLPNTPSGDSGNEANGIGGGHDQISGSPFSSLGSPSGSVNPNMDIMSQMEQSFGQSFADVNIHENSDQARQIDARAFAQGNDVHFAPGQYQPNTSEGKALLGHELTHVVQQRQGRVQATVQRKGFAINNDSQLESEADEMGKKAAKGEVLPAFSLLPKAVTSSPPTQLKPNFSVVQRDINGESTVPAENVGEAALNNESQETSAAESGEGEVEPNLEPLVSNARTRRGIKSDIDIFFSHISEERRAQYRGYAIVTDRFYFYNMDGSEQFSIGLRGRPAAGMYHVDNDSGSRIYLNTETGEFVARGSYVQFSEEVQERAREEGSEGPVHVQLEDWLEEGSNNISRVRNSSPYLLSVSGGAGTSNSATESEVTSEDEEISTEVQLPAWPSNLTGPSQVIANTSPLFTMSLDQQAQSESQAAAVIDEMVHIRYEYLIIDMTDAYNDYSREESERIMERGARIEEGEDLSGLPSSTNFEESQQFEEGSHATTGEERVGALATTRHNLERNRARLDEQNSRAEQKVHDRNSGLGERFIAAYNLSSEDTAEISMLGGAILDTFSEARSSLIGQKNIPIPNADGKHFLIKCIARPQEGNRLPSVDSVMIHTGGIIAAVDDSVDRQTFDLEARRELLLAQLSIEEDEEARANLQSQIGEINQTLNTSAADEIELQHGLRARLESRLSHLQDRLATTALNSQEETEILEEMAEIRTQIAGISEETEANLEERLQMARGRAEDFGNAIAYRPRVSFISEVTGNTSDLMMDLFNVGTDEAPNIRLSDLTTNVGGVYQGEGTNVSAAVDDCFTNFSAEAPYGPGFISVRSPQNFPHSFLRSRYRCLAEGGTLALERMEEQARIAGAILAVAGTGGAAGALMGAAVGVMGAIPSAVRLYERFENHSLRADEQSIGDCINVLSAFAGGAGALGKIDAVPGGGIIRFMHRAVSPIARAIGSTSDVLDSLGFLHANVSIVVNISRIQAQVAAGEMSELEGDRQINSLVANGIVDNGVLLIGSIVGENSAVDRHSEQVGHHVEPTVASTHPEDGGGRTDRHPILPPAPENPRRVPMPHVDPHTQNDSNIPREDMRPTVYDLPTTDTIPAPENHNPPDISHSDTLPSPESHNSPDHHSTLPTEVEPSDSDRATIPDVDDRPTVPDIDDRPTHGDVDGRQTVPDIDDRPSLPDAIDRETVPEVDDRQTIPDTQGPLQGSDSNAGQGQDGPRLLDAIDPTSDATMGSSGNHGSLSHDAGGGVFRRTIQLDDGSVVRAAIKVYPHFDQNGNSFESKYREDLRGAYAAAATGQAIEVYGPIDIGHEGYYAFAMEVAEGGFPTNESISSDPHEVARAGSEARRHASNINDRTFTSLESYTQALLDGGHYYEGECQGFVAPDGRFVPVDFQGISPLPSDLGHRVEAVETHNRNVENMRIELEGERP